MIEGSTRRIGSVLVNSGDFQGFTVVERSVAAAMMDHHGVVLRYLVEVVDVELAIIFYLSVVEEISFDPNARWSRLGLGA